MPIISFFEFLNKSINQLGFNLNNEIKFGDLITVITILGSLIALLISLNRDRLLRIEAQALRQKQQADIVRNCAARTLAKLERWKEISLSLFDRLSIIFIEADNAWVEYGSPDALVDLMNARVMSERVKNLQNVQKEEIESSYNDLYGFDPYSREFFENILDLLKEEEVTMYNKALLPGIEDIIDKNQDIEKTDRRNRYLESKLSMHADYIRSIYESRLSSIITSLSAILMELVIKDDKDILTISKNSFFNNKKLNLNTEKLENYGIITGDNIEIIMGQQEKNPS